MFSGVAWLLLRITVCGALVALKAMLPKPTTEGLADTGAVPVPERVTICGLEAALSSSVICPPAVVPVVVGAKSMPIVQLANAPSEPLIVPPAIGQVVTALVSSTNGPLKIALLRLRGLDWLLVSCTVLAALVVLMANAPKAIPVGATATEEIPVPERATESGLLAAFVDTVNVLAGCAPAAVGVNARTTVQVAPDASVGLRQVEVGLIE